MVVLGFLVWLVFIRGGGNGDDGLVDECGADREVW